MGSFRKYCNIDCTKEQPPMMANINRAAVITAADNQDDFFITQSGHYFEFHQEGTIDSVLFAQNAYGWVTPTLSQANDGWQIVQGGDVANAIGKDMSFTVCLSTLTFLWR